MVRRTSVCVAGLVCVPPAHPRRSPPPGAHRPRTPDAPRCARRGLASLRRGSLRFALRRWAGARFALPYGVGRGARFALPYGDGRGLASLCPTAMGGVRWFVSRPPTPAVVLRRGLTAPGPPTRLAALGAGLLRCAGARFASPYGVGRGLASLCPTAWGGGLASLCPTAMGGGLASHRPTAWGGGSLRFALSAREPGDPGSASSSTMAGVRQPREGRIHKPRSQASGESDEPIVPVKSAKARVTPAESMEGRGEAKGKPAPRNALRTQGRFWRRRIDA